jgi:hypothetical protein
VSLAATACIEVHGIRHPPSTNREDSIARLVCSLKHAEALAAKGEHFGHKRHTIEPAVAVQTPQYLLLGSNLDQVTCA